MPAKNNRIIIDTNLWISFLLNGNLPKLDRIIANKQVALLFSRELVREFITVTGRRKFKSYFATSDVEALLLALQHRATFIHVTSAVKSCRDPKDNFLLSLALDGKATHLLTGDKDLLTLKQFHGTRIITISEYAQLTEAQ